MNLMCVRCVQLQKEIFVSKRNFSKTDASVSLHLLKIVKLGQKLMKNPILQKNIDTNYFN